MSLPEIVQPEDWPRASGYAHGVSAHGRIVVVSGQVGWDPRTQQFESEDFVAQARRALINVVTVLEAASALPSDVVRLTWYITDREVYRSAARALGGVYREIFGSHYPAMSVIVVAELLEPRALLEIEATAVVADA